MYICRTIGLYRYLGLYIYISISKSLYLYIYIFLYLYVLRYLYRLYLYLYLYLFVHLSNCFLSLSLFLLGALMPRVLAIDPILRMAGASGEEYGCLHVKDLNSPVHNHPS